ncbi:hypothetical protein ACQ7JZ_000671 [Vibrio parahaemolyticus]|nr:hypothetical protein [Vibrio parahaemolyticus]
MGIKEFLKKIDKHESLTMSFLDRELDVSCVFEPQGIDVFIKIDSPRPFDDNFIDLCVSTDIIDSTISVSIIKMSMLSYEGKVQEIRVSDKVGNYIDKFNYLLAGVTSPFIVNDYKWERTYEFDGELIDVNYHFVNFSVTATLSTKISRNSNVFSFISEKITDEIDVLTWCYGFCRSSRSEWYIRREVFNDKTFSFHYLSSNATESYSNRVNPMRQEQEMFKPFIENVIKKGYSKELLTKKGVFQAIRNLEWNSKSIDDWTLLSHVAALEGFVKSKDVSILSSSKYRKIRDIMLTALKDNYSNFNVDIKDIDQISQNIYSNNRTLNGYPTKWYVDKALCDYNLIGFRDLYIDDINQALSKRNKIAHSGWGQQWERCVFDHVEVVRNTLYVLLMSFFGYQGDFYLFGQGKSNLQEFTNNNSESQSKAPELK